MVTCPRCKMESMEVVTECGEDFWLCHECNAEYDIDALQVQVNIKVESSIDSVDIRFDL